MTTNPPIIFVPATSLTRHDPELYILNANNEPAVDVYLGTDDDVTLLASLRPGRAIGEELMVRVIQRSSNVSGGVDHGNQASLNLTVLVANSLQVTGAYHGFGTTTDYTIPPYSNQPSFVGPITVAFRWNGLSWLPYIEYVPAA